MLKRCLHALLVVKTLFLVRLFSGRIFSGRIFSGRLFFARLLAPENFATQAALCRWLTTVRRLSGAPKTIALCAALLLFSACTTTAPRTELDGGPAIYSLEEYRQQLPSASGAQRDKIQLKIAEILLEKQQFAALSSTLQSIEQQHLSFNEKVQFMCINAQLLSATGNSKQALSSLPKNKTTYPAHLQRRVLSAQVYVYEKSNLPLLNSLQARAELQSLLTESAAVTNNAMAIIEGLQSLPFKTVEQYLAQKRKGKLYKWADFISKVKPRWLSSVEFEQKLGVWLYQNPNHEIPTTAINKLREIAKTSAETPDKIALILPLSGAYKNQAKSIKQGFFAAFYADDKRPSNASIYVYDSQQYADMASLIDAVNQRGVKMIVGPLLKDKIEQMLQKSAAYAPTLVLNRLPELDNPANDFFQFGLMPEDEAAQAAEFMTKQQYFRVAAIFPRSSIGARIEKEFNSRLLELGAQLVASSKYAAGTRDFSFAVKAILDIEKSKSRKSVLQTVLAMPLNFEDSGRSDLDALYVVADPITIRSIKPQLKFFDAEHLPVVASSQVYSATASGYAKDVEGVMFLQSPWLLGEQDQLQHSLQRIEPANFANYGSFYAMGADAYNLIPRLKRMRINNFMTFSGYSGTLFIDAKGRVKRRMQWAKYHNNRPVLIGDSQQNKPHD